MEFQKRGLPHCHILLTFDKASKIRNSKQIDNIVRAELPDKEKEPLLHELVKKHMIHGPCGVHNPIFPCMKNDRCTKKFPKSYNGHTMIDEKGYPIYRRRESTSVVLIQKVEIDSRWVVPYNPYLLLKYQAHINIEVCNHKKAVKYLFKYVNKGADSATGIISTTSVDRRDEIKCYLDSRYISASEACWRIFEFNLHRRFPPVTRLQYHLPGEHMVFFKENGSINSILTSDKSAKSMLTEWFVANRAYSNARELAYMEFPLHFVWNKRKTSWTPRKRGTSIGRLPYAHPASGERYFLRMLLGKIRGPTSYEDLRTIDGILHPTFKAACIAMGLLGDDNEWHMAIEEASKWATANKLRCLFTIILMFCEVIDPRRLWDSHWKSLCDDYEWRLKKDNPDLIINISCSDLKNQALLDIEEIMLKNGRTLREFPSLPFPKASMRIRMQNTLIFEETNYNIVDLAKESIELEENLNEEQQSIYNAVLASCAINDGQLFFVYGGGGTGKTYLWEALITKLRSQKKIVLAVASSGIAALLLQGGRTAHSRFKIPLDITEFSSCSISRGSRLAELIEATDLIIWDEAPMTSRFAFDAVDRTFRDLLQLKDPEVKEKPFGGKVVVLGGDFRQILPVVPKGNRQHIVGASLHKSNLWHNCKIYLLKKNMRLQNSFCDSERAFAQWILDIGNGDIEGLSLNNECDNDWIKIPQDLLIGPDHDIHDLIDVIYQDFDKRGSDPNYLKSRAILASRNDEVDDINDQILEAQPGVAKVYYSADTKVAISDEGALDDCLYTTEFLNSLQCSGLPSHCLKLKIGSPIMLLRNLNQNIGLCNGTRLIVRKLGERVIEAEIVTGRNIGLCVPLPRILMSSEKDDLPFVLKRRQFPVRLAFAMTINKSQGQTLDKIGLYLQTSVFSHGQFYVAVSRASSRDSLKILLEEQTDVPYGYTRNIVYKEVLQSVLEHAL